MRAVALPPVAQELTAEMRPPRCALPEADAYPPVALGDRDRCLTAAEKAARSRHAALAAAVRVREAKAAELAAGRDR